MRKPSKFRKKLSLKRLKLKSKYRVLDSEGKFIAYIDHRKVRNYLRKEVVKEVNEDTVQLIYPGRHLDFTCKVDKVLYNNILMLNKDGNYMCYIDEKRANWYVKKGLAVFNEDNTKITINFEPNGPGGYFSTFRNNICVVCGTDKFLSRHHVVPYEVRRQLESKFKTHNSHDVLGLCRDCHTTYELVAEEFKKEAKDLFYSKQGLNYYEAQRRDRRVTSFSRALGENWDKIPEKRKNEMILEVKDLMNLDETISLTLEDFKRLGFMPDCEYSWAVDFIAKFSYKELEEYIINWRKHFVDTMKPKFLPEDWDINTPILPRESP